MSLKQLRQAWDAFWFTEGSPLPMAFFRILVGMLILQFCWGISSCPPTFFGKDAVVSPATSAQWFGSPKLDLFCLLPQDNAWLLLAYRLLVTCAIFLTVGLFSRTSAFVAYLLLLSFQSRNNLAMFNILELLLLMALYLSFSRCGAALSADRLLHIRRLGKSKATLPEPGSIVAQRLVQIQIALIYWGAFSSKLQGETWINGTAVYYATHSLIFKQSLFPHLPFLDSLVICRLLSWSTLVLEFMLFTLIWVKELRYPVLLLGLCFHTGMELTLSIPMLQSIMVASYVTFVDGSDLTRVMALLKRGAARLVQNSLRVLRRVF